MRELFEESETDAQRRYRRLQKRSKKVTIKPSEKQGLGLYVDEDVQVSSVVLEYTGELLNEAQRTARELYYSHNGGRGDYIIQVGENRVYIDGGVGGNACRFANHSCAPNCIMKDVVMNDGDGEVITAAFMYALTDLKKGCEFTIDYEWKVTADEALHICECGANNCRGVIEKYFA